MGHSMSNQRKTNMTPPEFLQIWCGEGVYGLTQPHQILSETIKYSWICGHLNVAILTIFLLYFRVCNFCSFYRTDLILMPS